MKCKYCGTEVKDAKFCTNCGQPINEEYKVQMDNNNQVNKKGTTVFGVLAIVFSITFFLGFVGLIFAIIDLNQKDGTKKVLSKIAIGIFVFYSFLCIKSIFKNDKESINNAEIVQEVQQNDKEINKDIVSNLENENNLDTNIEIEEPEKKEPDFIVTVDELYNELDNNALKASSTYNNKYIELKGKISNIDAQGEYFNLSPLDDEYSWDSVSCKFSEEYIATVMNFSEGNEIVVRGTVSDVGEIFGYTLDVELIMTEFEEKNEIEQEIIIEGDKSIILITVDELYNQLNDNALKASNTYEGKYIELTGILSNIDAQGNYFSLSPLDDEWSWDSVNCQIDEKNLATVMEFSDGAEIVVRGTISSVGEVFGYILDIDTIVSY